MGIFKIKKYFRYISISKAFHFFSFYEFTTSKIMLHIKKQLLPQIQMFFEKKNKK